VWPCDTSHWIKCKKSDTFPVVAFVEKLGARPRKVASLYVGRREGDKLLYAGKVQTGYTETSARELRERLDPLVRKTSPLSIPVKKPKASRRHVLVPICQPLSRLLQLSPDRRSPAMFDRS
jgi:ATP-dependent DNA ligase